MLDIPACSCLRADAPLQPRERRKVVHPWEVYRASRDLLVVKQVLLEKSEEVLCGFRTFCFHRALKSLQQWPEHGLAWSHGEAMFGGSWAVQDFVNSHRSGDPCGCLKIGDPFLGWFLGSLEIPARGSTPMSSFFLFRRAFCRQVVLAPAGD